MATTAGQASYKGNRQPAVRPGTSQNVTISGTTAKNATAFGADTELVRISCTTDLYYKIGGSSVEAAAADVLLPSGTTETVRINKGVDTHIAGIQVSGGGVMNLAECT